jgi:hypothetical protein
MKRIKSAFGGIFTLDYLFAQDEDRQQNDTP